MSTDKTHLEIFMPESLCRTQTMNIKHSLLIVQTLHYRSKISLDLARLHKILHKTQKQEISMNI